MLGRTLALTLASLALTACGPAPNRQPLAPKSGALVKRAPNERAATPRGRLADALARVKPSGPVLDALPPSLRGKLVELVARLAPERRAELIRAARARGDERGLG